MLRNCFLIFFGFISSFAFSQTKWQNVDSLYQPLPKSLHIFYTQEPIDTAPFRAFYIVADLKDKNLDFTTDTTFKRRLTPSRFYEKNNQPLVIVNGTFFSFETNQNLNVVAKEGQVIARNQISRNGIGKDSINIYYVFKSAIGISKKRRVDIAWIYSGIDSSSFPEYINAYQWPLLPVSIEEIKTNKLDLETPKRFDSILSRPKYLVRPSRASRWKVQTAIGGGPVLVQRGKIVITNEEEKMFSGKAINDKHPRTAMGYTADNKLIILVVEGRNPNAGGATLKQEAQILKDLGCVEALNLDGGGSSCLLINGKETIKPSDKEGQRAVPAVFMIRNK